MDQSLYNNTTTARGLTYHYYYSSTAPEKPTLLFPHGFPSSSYDWHRQVRYFQAKGYGTIVPDVLGAGGTSKPENVNAFCFVDIARDIVDVLDAVGVDKVIGVGHDWGSTVLSRLANLFSSRFDGFAWISTSYYPPSMGFHDIDEVISRLRAQTRSDHLGYWKHFLLDNAYEKCEQNVSFTHHLMLPMTSGDPSPSSSHRLTPSFN
ncbi:hypothetical protein BN946_scf184927.g3 [Trametes cinnabarina]|uniref:AB hydrolase-1 domain-containing protein n=1 Tax=Pycnoporus cinnabarinus TaxID=5643 RepID=A0A060SRT2_PYCCI|nr:hypothetical protein BN946_scf184927.g3 [Trametes cinnabarina]